MKAIKFEKRSLVALLRELRTHHVASEETQLFEELVKLYGPGMLYAQDLPASTFVQDSVVVPERYTAVVFRCDNRSWRAVAVFNIAPEVRATDVGFDLAAAVIEYVPITREHVMQNYLATADFRKRSRKAIYAPTESTFRHLPRVQSGWDANGNRKAEI